MTDEQIIEALRNNGGQEWASIVITRNLLLRSVIGAIIVQKDVTERIVDTIGFT